MSQQLIPISGGVQILQTSSVRRLLNVPSQQYIKVNRLENRPTEWVPKGRPIYRRLPAVSNTYQINFFDILPAVNTAVRLDETRDIGYVYIPWGQGIFGPTSLEVVSSDSRGDLVIKSGRVVWKYGTTEVFPALVNLREIDFGSGRYLVAYQLVYDDSPTENYYAVTDYSLAGTKLVVTSSCDQVLGWRYTATNAFLNSDRYWSNSDTYFPTYAQPTESFIQWESNEFFQRTPIETPKRLPSAYSKVVLRCPLGTTFTGSATLSYVEGSTVYEIQTATISKDGEGQFFEFEIESPSFQTQWKIVFTDLKMRIRSITVSGVVAKVTKPSGPSTKCALAIYPADTVPDTVLNSRGEEIPATYCKLAYIDVDSSYKLTDIVDIRPIIQNEYKPIADWLTTPFDENLISLYEQVNGYQVDWMAPTQAMNQEYLKLSLENIELE